MTITSLNGANLFHDAIGAGPPMLMMHGSGLDHTYLRPWHDVLADQAKVIYYDHRWNGRSERVGPADHSTWHADAAALLDHLGHRRATIYGHSYGAWLALGFALRHPRRVSGLVLSGCSPAFDYLPEVIARAQERNPALAATLISGFGSPPATDDELATIWRRILPLYFHGEPRPDILAHTQFSATGFNLGLQALEGFTVVEELRQLEMPILILTGRHDYITPPAQGQRIVAGARRAELVELTESGHFPFVEETARYIGVLRGWLAQHT